MKLFLASLASQTLDLAIPLLPDKPNKLKVAYIPTAMDPYIHDGENLPWMHEGKDKLVALGFQVINYDLKGKNTDLLRKELSSFQVIYVEGGNAFYLFNEVKESGFNVVVKELLLKGIVYIGSSAGSMIMGPDLNYLTTIDHPEIVPELTDFTSLGLIKERIVPHAGREKYLERHAQIKKEWGDKVTFLSDDQAIIVDGNNTKTVKL